MRLEAPFRLRNCLAWHCFLHTKRLIMGRRVKAPKLTLNSREETKMSKAAGMHLRSKVIKRDFLDIDFGNNLIAHEALQLAEIEIFCVTKEEGGWRTSAAEEILKKRRAWENKRYDNALKEKTRLEMIVKAAGRSVEELNSKNCKIRLLFNDTKRRMVARRAVD